MPEIDNSAPVLVTGATGYIAGQLVKQLLARRCTVHATVRNVDNHKKLDVLRHWADHYSAKLVFFAADLLEQDSFTKAMRECQLVFHTASPFLLSFSDPQQELVEPALSGTRNVLQSASAVGSVRRVVLTSSCAALYGDNADLQQTPNGAFTEAMWNHTASLAYNPYAYAKTLAEQEAWKLASAQQQWDLVSINPSLVVGPGIWPEATSGSVALLRQMLDGTMRLAAPRIGNGVVDVRDVALAHIQAGLRAQASGRYLISAHNSDIFELTQILRQQYGSAFPLPCWAAPKWLLWLFGPLKSYSRRLIARNVNLPWVGDNSRSVRELGMRYRPLAASLTEQVEQLLVAGIVHKN